MKVLELAHLEARRLNHEFVGTEHILLVLLGEPEGDAARVLRSLGVTPAGLSRALLERLEPLAATAIPHRLPLTPGARQALELALEAAQQERSEVRTGHLLLGLVRGGVGVAPRLLRESGVDVEDVRQALLGGI